MNQMDYAKEKNSAEKINPILDFFKPNKIFDHILFGAIIVFFIYYFFIIFSQLHETLFWADENIHSYIANIISQTHQIPYYLPDDIYGKYILMYPPLLHILGAFVISFAGISALKYINLILLVIFFLSFFMLIKKYYDKYTAFIACLLISLSPVLAINSVRFMTEMLSMLMIFYSFFFMMLALKTKKNVFIILSGLFTGLFILSKQVGIIIISYYILLLFWFLIKKNRNDAKIMLYIIGASVLVIAPYFLNAIAQDVNILEMIPRFGNYGERYAERAKVIQRFDSGLKEFAYLFYKGNGSLLSISLLIPFYYFIRKRTKNPPYHYIFTLTVYLAIAMVIHHITNSRHTITFLPLIGFLVGYTFIQLFSQKIILNLVLLCLLITAGYNTYHLPNHRQQFNASKEFIKIAETVKEDDSHGRTLCINPFDALMYSEKPVIWPTIHLANPPFEILDERDMNNFYSLLKKYEINHIIIWTKFLGGDYFIRNYPLYFYNNCRALISRKKMSVVTISEFQSFYLLKVL